MENFKYIPDTENRYIIYEDGRVYDLVKCKYLKIGHASKRYYKTVNIETNNKKQMKYVHRLLAICYIPNPENKPQVNHKDANPLNNSLDNLEWVTVKENIHHAWDSGLCKSWNAGKSVFYNEEIRNKVFELRALGHTQKEIGLRVGIHPKLVWNIIENIPNKKSRRVA